MSNIEQNQIKETETKNVTNVTNVTNETNVTNITNETNETNVTNETNETKNETDLIEQSLLCGVCKDILYDSKTLMCQHNFCSSCLVSQKHCPICRLKIIDQPRTNPIFNNLVEILYDNKKIQELKNKNYEKELLPKVLDELKNNLNTTIQQTSQKENKTQHSSSNDTYVLGYNITTIIKYLEIAFLLYYIYSFIKSTIYDFNWIKCVINLSIILQSCYTLFIE
jgi:hypothetical protein